MTNLITCKFASNHIHVTREPLGKESIDFGRTFRFFRSRRISPAIFKKIQFRVSHFRFCNEQNWLNHFSYYFDNGNVASESVVVDEKHYYNGSNSYNYTFSGTGYFRVVYRGRSYVLQYEMKDSNLEGSLSMWSFDFLNMAHRSILFVQVSSTLMELGELKGLQSRITLRL